MTSEMHSALCKNGDLAGLVASLDQEKRPVERERFYIGTFNLTYKNHPQVAMAIGTRYIEEYYQSPEPFGPGHFPSGDILKRLVLLFDPSQYKGEVGYNGDRGLAVWVCKFALAFGVSDGTTGGFQERLKKLEQIKDS